VALSFTLPFALVPLLILTGREAVMGKLVNRKLTSNLGWATTTVIVSLNLYLLWQTLVG
jgi:manganese transport protein